RIVGAVRLQPVEIDRRLGGAGHCQCFARRDLVRRMRRVVLAGVLMVTVLVVRVLMASVVMVSAGPRHHKLAARCHGVAVVVAIIVFVVVAVIMLAFVAVADRLAGDPLPAPVGAALGLAPRIVVGLGVGFALRALFLVDQRLPVGDRDLIVVRMDFA